MLEGIECFANHYVALERENGIPQMRVTDLGSGQFHYVEFPEPVYVAYPWQNAEFDTTNFA